MGTLRYDAFRISARTLALKSGSLLATCLFELICPSTGFAGPSCLPQQSYDALDLSQPVNTVFLQHVKSLGIATIIRYYDWKDETIPHKTLTLPELNLIHREGLKVAVVFQHHNDQTATFEDPTRGETDALRSLELANGLLQPETSAIYFGVDGVDDKFTSRGPDPYGLSKITNYFVAIQKTFKAKNKTYKVGVYGSGLVCRVLLSKNLAQYCWLSNAKSWPEYANFESSHKWVLKQSLMTDAKSCFGMSVDLDQSVKPGTNFGQW